MCRRYVSFVFATKGNPASYFWVALLTLFFSFPLNAQVEVLQLPDKIQQVRVANDLILAPQPKPVIPKTSLSYKPMPIAPDTVGNGRVELLQAIELQGQRLNNGKEVRVVRGKDLIRVIFRHNGALITCDSALHFPDSNFVAAYGRIEVKQGDTLSLKGDTAFYYGNNRFAQMRGHIEMKEKTRVLNTTALDYDMQSGIAGYYNKGKVVDDTSVLESKIGYYDTRNKKITFIEKVSIYNRITGETLNSDTLVYDVANKSSQFNSKTTIKTKDATIETQGGIYDPNTSSAEFFRRTCIENDEYRICADYLKNDKAARLSVAKGNVSLHQKLDTLFLYGQSIIKQGDRSRVFGEPVLIKPFGKDSLFMTADTLLAIADSSQAQSIHAFNKVKIFSEDFQAVADSLVYLPSDSVFRFFRNPALWSSDNQLTADSIDIFLKDSKIDELRMRKNAFIVSKNPLNHFDQVAGKNMKARFKENALNKVNVDGNGQLLYHLLDKGALQAVNRMDCSDMIITFADSNKLANLYALTKPEAKLVPPNEITQNEKKLPKFVWRNSERPLRYLFDILLKRNTEIQDPRFKIAGGVKICDKPFYIVFSKDSVLNILKDKASSEDIRESFFVEIKVDSSKIENWDSLRNKSFRYEFQVKDKALDDEFLRYEYVLDSIPFLSLRIGQFKKIIKTNIRLNEDIVEKPELWFCEWHKKPLENQPALKIEENTMYLKK